MENILVKPGKFVCPENFVEAGLEGLCIEDLDDEDNELWLIEAPAEANILNFHGQKIELSGITKIEQSSQNYEFCATNSISNELAEFQLIVQSNTENRLCAVSKPFQGHIKITKSFKMPESCSVLKSPVKGYEMPNDLKPRYKAFGGDEPHEAPEKPRKHQSEKRKKHKSKCEDHDVSECISIDDKLESDGDVSKMSSQKKKKQHRSHKSHDHSLANPTDSDIDAQPNDSVSSSSVLHSKKAKKKKKKVKTEEMSE